MVTDHALAFLLTVMVMIGIPITWITSSPIDLLTLAGATADQFRRKSRGRDLRIGEALESAAVIASGAVVAQETEGCREPPTRLTYRAVAVSLHGRIDSGFGRASGAGASNTAR
jgi:hypothetical protein